MFELRSLPGLENDRTAWEEDTRQVRIHAEVAARKPITGDEYTKLFMYLWENT